VFAVRTALLVWTGQSDMVNQGLPAPPGKLEQLVLLEQQGHEARTGLPDGTDGLPLVNLGLPAHPVDLDQVESALRA